MERGFVFWCNWCHGLRDHYLLAGHRNIKRNRLKKTTSISEWFECCSCGVHSYQESMEVKDEE